MWGRGSDGSISEPQRRVLKGLGAFLDPSLYGKQGGGFGSSPIFGSEPCVPAGVNTNANDNGGETAELRKELLAKGYVTDAEEESVYQK